MMNHNHPYTIYQEEWHFSHLRRWVEQDTYHSLLDDCCCSSSYLMIDVRLLDWRISCTCTNRSCHMPHSKISNKIRLITRVLLYRENLIKHSSFARICRNMISISLLVISHEHLKFREFLMLLMCFCCKKFIKISKLRWINKNYYFALSVIT